MSQAKAHRLQDLINKLSTLNNGSIDLINNVKTLKDEQIALYDAVKNVVNIVLNSLASNVQIDALIKNAEEGEAKQKKILDSIKDILGGAPQRDAVNTAIKNLQDAVARVDPTLKFKVLPPPLPVKGQQGPGPEPGPGQGKRGGFKYKRDASARTEVRSQSVSMPARTGLARTGLARTKLIKKTLSSNKRNKSRYTKTFKK